MKEFLHLKDQKLTKKEINALNTKDGNVVKDLDDVLQTIYTYY